MDNPVLTPAINPVGLNPGEGPAVEAKAVVLDQSETNVYRWLYVGGPGNVTGRLIGDTDDTVLYNLAEGALYPICFSVIRTSGTTATNLVLLR